MPLGFRAGAATVGIKASGKPDLMIIGIGADAPDASVAAVYTSNLMVAAPIVVSRRHLSATDAAGGGRYGWTRAVICTSGCANAATGPDGEADQETLAIALAEGLGTDPYRTVALSTGVIGTRLPAARIAPDIRRLASDGLSDVPESLAAAGRAMCTTDSRPKSACASLTLPDGHGAGVVVTVSGIAKGVGMIHPRMATMLAVVLTDAAVAPAALYDILRGVAARTWNQLTVDGDTSTNDTVFLLASGGSGATPVATGSPEAQALTAAIESVARSLARQQAADGEGATTLITCQVIGAMNDADARAVARSVVASSLVKAAVHGRDPNWGRIAAAGNARLADAAILEAAGMSSEEAARRQGAAAVVDPLRLRIAIAGTDVFAGSPLAFDRAAVRTAMDAPELLIAVDLGSGHGTGEAFGCDLTEQYVIENAEYTT